MRNFLILGAGFTGSRVVQLLQAANQEVRWTSRAGRTDAIRFDAALGNFSELSSLINPETRILHSIPTLKLEERLVEITPSLVTTLRFNTPGRIVYLSTTGVYGPARNVDEQTPPLPMTDREHLRLQAEDAIRLGPWSTFILRPAAIYGPHRGIHHGMRAGTFRLPQDSSNFVSRIHVDDLAAHAFAALMADDEGSYPVADEEPCTSLEAAQYCATLLGVPLPQVVPASDLGETRRADRRVDGSAVRKLLRVMLRYPSYKTGFPACLAAEMRERSIS